MPPNRGRILVEHDNKAELRFWIRVFELEGALAQAQARFNAHKEQTEAEWACVPIISHYVSGELTWFFVARL